MGIYLLINFHYYILHLALLHIIGDFHLRHVHRACDFRIVKKHTGWNAIYTQNQNMARWKVIC